MKIQTFTKDDDGVHRAEFESVTEMIEVAMARGEGNHAGNTTTTDQGLTNMVNRSKWYNGYDREKILAAIANPPEDLVIEVERIKDQIETDAVVPTGRRRRVARRLEVGDELDAVAWVQRAPNGWSESQYQTERKHLVRIAVNVTVNCKQKPEHLLYRGAAAAALADALTVQGYSVEVVAFFSVNGYRKHASRDERHLTRVIVKRADTPMDLPSLAFALSEIAFFRGVVMNASARLLTAEVRGGHGYCRSLPHRDRAEFDIVLDNDITTKAAAVAVVNRYAEGIKVTN